MTMTNGEILRDYRGAKDKKAQVKILAELNACSVQQIKEILISEGVDGRELPKSRKKSVAEKPELSAEGAVGGEEESLILRGLCCLFRQTEQKIAEAEAEYQEKMKHYTELLQKLCDMIAERDKVIG